MKEKYIRPQFVVVDLDMTCVTAEPSKLKTDTGGEGGDFSGGTGFGDDYEEPGTGKSLFNNNKSVSGTFVGDRPVY